MRGIKFDVVHYGTIIKNYEDCINGQYLRYRIYQYKNKLYLYVMLNGAGIMFKEVRNAAI